MARKKPAAAPLWPADEQVRVPLSKLIPYARNARTHSDAQIAQIAASMKEWGWTIPVLIDEAHGIIAGHGRILAGKLNGYTEAPCIVARGWSEQKKRAYVLADNKLTLNGGWDEDLLRIELSELVGTEYFDLVGWDQHELDDLLAGRTEGLTDPDDAPPAPVNPVTVKGDVWLLGRHRLVCGSSTDAHDVMTALAGVKPHLMVTDPPYGVNYDPSWRTKAGVGSAGAAMGKVMNDDRADWREAWALFPGAVAYVWHGGLHASVVENSLDACKFRTRSQIIWVKSRPALSRGHYHWQHEPAFYVVKQGKDDRFNTEHEVASYAVLEGRTADWQGSRKQSTVWFIEHLKSDTGHGTQKPVECMKRPIENNSRAGQAIYEPFSGSGTTIIAAEMTGRACHALELDPAYVDVAVQRWQAFTGQTAVLDGDGRTFAQIDDDRYARHGAALNSEGSHAVAISELRKRRVESDAKKTKNRRRRAA